MNGIGPGFLRGGLVGATHFSQKRGVIPQRPFYPEMVFAHGVLREGDGPMKQGIGFFIFPDIEVQQSQVVEGAFQA